MAEYNCFCDVKWYDDDISEALAERGIEPTQNNVATIRSLCEDNSHFTESMIQAGWESIKFIIDEASANGSLEEKDDDRYETILDYPDFSVVYDSFYGRYYYTENDGILTPLKLVASLTYDALDNPNEDALQKAFDCFVCGESVSDDHIQFLWFDRDRV